MLFMYTCAFYELIHIPPTMHNAQYTGNKEHSIQHIKPELKLMRKTCSYLKKKLTNIMRKSAFKWIKDNFVSNEDAESLSRSGLFLDAFDAFGGTNDDNDDDDDNDNGSDNDGNEKEDEDEDEDPMPAVVSNTWFSGYHRYESSVEVNERLAKGKPLSGFFFNTNPVLSMLLLDGIGIGFSISLSNGTQTYNLRSTLVD